MSDVIEAPYSVNKPIEEFTEGLTSFQLEVVKNIDVLDPTASRRYALCGKDGLGIVAYCASCEEVSPDFYARYHPLSCMLRICPDCAKRLSGDTKDRLRPVIEHLFAHPKRGYRVRGITLTRSVGLSNEAGDDLLETIEMTMQLCEEMILDDPNAGVIVTSEAGENGGKFHTHIIASSKYIRQVDISKTWERITGGDSVVWIREYATANEAINEGLKYVLKPQSLNPLQMAQLHFALKGKRRVRTRGIFYKSKNNPYSHLFGSTDREPCQCPDCNSNLQYVGESTFDLIKHGWAHLTALSVREACQFQSMAQRASLHLTEANKFSNKGPP